MAGQRSSGYWYDDDRVHAGVAVRILDAMRDYRAAETAMRKRTRESMGMGETDLQALRLLLSAQKSGQSLGPKDLARDLGISSASTTILVDRLEKRGHVMRLPHPSDRRAIVVEATDATDLEMRDRLGAMHERMMRVVSSLSPDDSRVVIDFLDAMRRAVDDEL